MMKQAFGWCVKYLVLCCILPLAATAAAASPIWTKIYAGNTMAVAVSAIGGPQGEVVYVADVGVGQVLSTNDGGATWTPVLAETALSLATDPNSPATVYAATGTGLYRSTDYGANWTLLIPDVHVWVIVSPADSQTIYGDSAKSTDGGLTWTGMTGLGGLSGSGDLGHIKICTAVPNEMLAFDGGGPYISHDGGETWLRHTCLDGQDSVEIDPVDPDYSYSGACGGGSMRTFPGGCAGIDDPGHLHGFVIDPASHNIVYRYSRIGIERSLDFGASWAPFMLGYNGSTSFDGYPNGRAIFDSNSGRIYLPDQSGLWTVETWGSCQDMDGDLYFSAEGCGTAVDCNDFDPVVNPGAAEDCTDGIDNDCDLLVDAADPDAVNCPPDCTDLDGDTYSLEGSNCGPIDCNDNDPLVNPGAVENCSNSVDDDCDNLIDINDTDCQVIGPEICSDLFDNDGDGKVDCADKDCKNDPACAVGETEVCDDGIDNDGDGKIDCADRDCRRAAACN